MKPQNIYRKVITPLNALFITVILLSGCAKTVEVDKSQSDQPYFYKTYSSSTDAFGTFVDGLPNGDIIIAGASSESRFLDPKAFIIKRTDKYGSAIWEKEIPMAKEFFTQGTVMSNGDYVFNTMFGSSEVIRITADGEVVFHTQFNTNMSAANFLAAPFEDPNGDVLIAYTNGPGTGSASSNYVHRIDGEGNSTGVLKLEDYDFNGKILGLKVLKIVDDEYWISGMMFEAPFTGWSNVIKTFVAKVKPGSRADVYVKDSRDPKFGMERGSIFTSDNHVVTISSKTSDIWEETPQPQSTFDVIKINKLVDLKWKTTVSLDVLTLEPWSIVENSNGEYVITGHCSVPGSSGRLPFVVKISTDGVVNFSKIFKLAESVEFLYGKQIDDGFIFAGDSEGFGNSIDQSNLVLMKTNALGGR